VNQQLSNQPDRANFSRRLLRWYDSNRRDLPWRRTADPYCIWLSEIMLQQTRVGAVLEHYRLFLERFPTVRHLARAREQSVLAMWSGLGYYRRARNLHAAAKVIVTEYDGRCPDTYEALLDLPGVGRYTAAAIASIAFGETRAVVDGNVERVLHRVTGTQLGSAQTWALAQTLLHKKRPGDFNQAMMELGATVCLPRGPRCEGCPVFSVCETRGALPSEKRAPRSAQRISFLLAEQNGRVCLVQRPKSASLMANMWELPQLTPNGAEPAARLRHAILNTDFDVSVFRNTNGIPENARWTPIASLRTVALTGLARKVLRHFRMF
jgi:A/G-specific adenine glycosylase